MGTQIRPTFKLIQRIFSVVLLFVFFAAAAAPKSEAQTRLVVRDVLGLADLQKLCRILNCTVDRGLGDPDGQLFVVKSLPLVNALPLESLLKLLPAITGIEVDQIVNTAGADAGPAPYYLTDRTPVNYYGTTVWRGYTTQPAAQLIQVSYTQSQFKSTGSGVIVAVI